jgi:hypothetical protein
VLFESILKANPKNPSPAEQTLGVVLTRLGSDLAIPTNLPIGRTTFPDVVRDLSSADDEIETAVKFAGRIRNTVGHDLGWEAEFGRSEYDMLASVHRSNKSWRDRDLHAQRQRYTLGNSADCARASRIYCAAGEMRRSRSVAVWIWTGVATSPKDLYLKALCSLTRENARTRWGHVLTTARNYVGYI